MAFLSAIKGFLKGKSEVHLTVRSDGEKLCIVVVSRIENLDADTTDEGIAALQAALARPFTVSVPADEDPDAALARALTEYGQEHTAIGDDLAQYKAAAAAARKSAQQAAAAKKPAASTPVKKAAAKKAAAAKAKPKPKPAPAKSSVKAKVQKVAKDAATPSPKAAAKAPLSKTPAPPTAAAQEPSPVRDLFADLPQQTANSALAPNRTAEVKTRAPDIGSDTDEPNTANAGAAP